MDKDKIIEAIGKAQRAANSEQDQLIFNFLSVSNFGIMDNSVSESGKKAIADLAKGTLDAAATMLYTALIELFGEK